MPFPAKQCLAISGVGEMGKRVILTVSGVLAADIHEQIASGNRPRADYLELARGFDADIIDYVAARKIAGRIGKALERVGGANLVLAFACWKVRKSYQAIVTDGEQVGLPLATLLKLTPGAAATPFDDRPCHFGAEEDRFPGLAGRAKRHRPFHHLQSLATAIYNGAMEVGQRPRAVDALYG